MVINMSDEIYNFLVAYKNINEKMISCIQKDELEAIDSMIAERQNIIDALSKIKYAKEEFTNIADKLNLVEDDKIISELMLAKKKELEDNILKHGLARHASNNYSKKFAVDSIFFNKKI
jgi:hypothetical protein